MRPDEAESTRGAQGGAEGAGYPRTLTFGLLETPHESSDPVSGEEVTMNIGQAAKRSGLPAKTIRYYEECGLLQPPERDAHGYRRYETSDVQFFRLLRQARRLGFTMTECRELIDLYRDRNRSSADVANLALRRIGEIDRKIDDLQTVRRALSDLVARCRGDARPDCPMVDDIGGAPRHGHRERSA